MKDTYRLSPHAAVYHRDTIEPFNYSDGSEQEQRLLDIVSGASDVSTFSDDLLRAISDWPSEYHFTRARHCLIRPLDIRPGDRVLELGCGCGAITRYLGEIGAEVTAVEGSFMRARIASERCRDLPNVRVVVDDLLKFDTDESFDWVTLIGVLEYAPKYSDAADPVHDYLRSARRYLATDGNLVVAIENRLGLKYFNGCAEDHLGVPYIGIQDTYEQDSARTFGRRELSSHLRSAGLTAQRFLYPWPDYKLPAIVLDDTALQHEDFLPSDMLARSHARDYSGNELRSFDDALAIDMLVRNGLLGDLSNSFLVVAGQHEPVRHRDFVAASYAVKQRKARYCTETRIVRDSTGALSVDKRWLTDADGRMRADIPVSDTDEPREVSIRENLAVSQRAMSAPYYRAHSMLWPVLKCNAGGKGGDAMVEALLDWFDHLLSLCLQSPDLTGGNRFDLGDLTIEGIYLDCNPSNVLVTADGPVDIDLEWQLDNPIELGWVLCRGVQVSLSRGLSLVSRRSSILQVVRGLCAQRSLEVTAEQVDAWLQLEADLQEALTGSRPELDASTRPGTRMTPIYLGTQAVLKRHAVGAAGMRRVNAVQLIDGALAQSGELQGTLTRLERTHAKLQDKLASAQARGDRYQAQLVESSARVQELKQQADQLDSSLKCSLNRLASSDAQLQELLKLRPVRFIHWCWRRIRKPGTA